MGLAWGAFSAASAAALAATGRFMFPNVLNEPPQQFKAGFPNEYGMGVDERWKEKFGVWIVRTPDDIVQHAAASTRCIVTCTHLGCTPNYLSAESKFKCPCHGSGFRTDRHQLRGAGAAAARARAHRAGRRRTDPGRQEPEVPARARAVDRSGGVPEGVTIRIWSGSDRDPEISDLNDRAMADTKTIAPQESAPAPVLELADRDAGLDVGLPARPAEHRPQPRAGDAVERLPAPAPGADPQVGHQAALHLVHGRAELLPVPRARPSPACC